MKVKCIETVTDGNGIITHIAGNEYYVLEQGGCGKTIECEKNTGYAECAIFNDDEAFTSVLAN